MDTAAVGLTQEEDGEWGIDQQDIFHRVILFLAAITVRLFSSILGADDAPFRPVMGKSRYVELALEVDRVCQENIRKSFQGASPVYRERNAT